MEFKENIKNIELFKRRVIGARLSRGRSIPSKNIIDFSVSKSPSVRVIANILGSENRSYVINIFQDEKNIINIIHDCPDFRKGNSFCKHIVKILSILEYEICAHICKDLQNIKFSSNFNLVKESKIDSYILKANELLNEKKIEEAIGYLNQAYENSKDQVYIEKIIEISLENEIYYHFLNYIKLNEDLINFHSKHLPKVIKLEIGKIQEYDFQKQINLAFSIQDILIKLPKNKIKDIFSNIDLKRLNSFILRYILISKFKDLIYVEDFFQNELKLKDDLESFAQNFITEALNESIMNMETEDIINSYQEIINRYDFSNKNQLLMEIERYRKKIKNLYKDGLKLKHAFLRSLVISNFQKDTLRTMPFSFRYRWPNLVWTSPYKSESQLHYFILEKCGFERHHLEYVNKKFFIENFPIFSGIFGAKNIFPKEVKDFWSVNDPKIENSIFDSHHLEVDFDIIHKSLNDYMLIEWDLVQAPILGSYIYQFDQGFIIPDLTHPLTYNIQPFDLYICLKKPINIKQNNTKIIRPIRKINVKTAIEFVHNGIEFITTYLPFQVIIELKNKKIDEIDAWKHINQQMDQLFSPKKNKFKQYMSDFIQTQINKDFNEFYLKIVDKEKNRQKVLDLIGFKHYFEIFNKRIALQKFKIGNLKRNSLQELKVDLKNFVVEEIVKIVKQKRFNQINIKKLKEFPAFKNLSLKIIQLLKDELEECKIYKIEASKYDITELLENYYGKKIVEGSEITILNDEKMSLVSTEDLKKLLSNFSFLKIDNPEITHR
ncbi:MAG: hypothetical protein EU529_13635 [Promethearchaeota archaeon]|nr:MAG: hypothetical protein EU529_13635 [Candidatus Lokiarchaeota archaeon]